MERSFILTVVDFTKQVHFESYFLRPDDVVKTSLQKVSQKA